VIFLFMIATPPNPKGQTVERIPGSTTIASPLR